MDIYATNPGPFDDSVLYDQDKHVSSAVWEGQERGALRCHEHTSKLDQWTLTPRQIDLVKMAGFGPLRLIPAISLDNPLISALVERWRRETNTFHFTVGEMTVTLEDVAYLLGLPIDGDPVIGVTYTSCEAVCVKYLGRAPGSGYTSGGMVKLSWLKETFSRCPVDAPIQDIERHTRAYLLYLVGSTIFSTTTGNKVPVMYLPLFDNFDQAGRYAWGAAALAFLYRALGNASLKSQSTISGCLTMLQCWSFYHLNVGRPRLNHDPVHDCFPFVLRWKGKQSSPTANRDVPFYRKALDALKETDVEWCPYTHNHHALLPEEIKNTLIVGRSKTMLICFDKAERHLPDRCLRQYGMKQKIPAAVPLWERKSRGVDGGVDLSGKMETELAEWSDRHRCIEDSYDEYADENEYMMWYTRISRKVIGRPVPISSEYQRMNAALRDIAHLADALYNSTHGMDDAQIYSVTRIHSIVHDCLRDQGGSPLVMVSNPENEMVKTVRGKEKVRRKGMGKRRRKDELEERNATAEAQLCGVADEIDAVDLHHQQLSHMDIEVVGMEHQHLCLPVGDGDVDDEQLCDPADIICDSELANVEESEVKSSSFGDEDDKPHTDDVQLSALETNEEVAQQNDCSVLV